MSDETTPQPDVERVEGEANQGVGWYEFITPTATTGIAYVHEGGDIYVPGGGWGPTEPFHLAASRGHVHRLIRADALGVEEMARVQVAHDRRIWSSGEVECACGEWQVTRDAEGYTRSTNEFRAEAVRAHMEHVAIALRAALLGDA